MLDPLEYDELKLIEPYNLYLRVTDPIDLIEKTGSVAQHFAVKHKIAGKAYFHHFLFTSYDANNDGTIEIHIIHKYRQSAANLILQALSLDKNATIKYEKVKFHLSNSGVYQVQKGYSDLFDFKSGLFLLGEYDDYSREKAIQRAFSMIGKKELYSGQSFNCEHFVTWCFNE